MPASASGTIFAATLRQRVPAAAAADATADFVIGEAPAAGAVLEVTFTPDTVLTGADTNSMTGEIINAGQAGAGTTQVAAKAFTNGVNAAAKDETDITLHATAANRDVVAGDVLCWRRTKVGTGLAQPGGLVQIKIGAS